MEFPQWVVDRVTARQGCLHPYDEFDASTTAFVVVDLQNYFTQPGFMGQCPAARETFGPVNKLANALRAAGGTVVWIQTCSDGADKFWSHFHGTMLTPERHARRLKELSASHKGFELSAELDVRPEDVRIVKRSYSALAPGSSALDAELKARGISTVLVGGTVTNVCCESTAREAMMMDYATVMVDDTLSAFSREEHVNTLNNFMLFFGDVLSADDVIARIKPARRTAHA
jgi:ureidoacrylate peracid hydrolase